MKNNKGITLISLMLTVIIILILTSAIIFNTKNQLQMRTVQYLFADIEMLNSKVDDYYLKYGELPRLCDYTNGETINFKNKNDFLDSLNDKASAENSNLNIEKINQNDGDEYIVIDLEKMDGLTLNYGYDEEYKYLKNMQLPKVVEYDGDTIEDEIYVINTKTHQIYFPHGIFVDNVMYCTF